MARERDRYVKVTLTSFDVKFKSSIMLFTVVSFLGTNAGGGAGRTLRSPTSVWPLPANMNAGDEGYEQKNCGLAECSPYAALLCNDVGSYPN